VTRIIGIAAFVLAASLSSSATSTADPAAAAPLPPDSVYQLAAQLTDQDGVAHDWASYRGKPRVVSMFYTSCQFICPLIIDSDKAIERSLTPAQLQRLGFVLISIDPVRDTPKALRGVLEARHLDPLRWSLLSPSAADVRAFAALLDIRYRVLADGDFNHTTALILLDADGRLLARTEQVGARLDMQFLDAVRRATGG
jgi:protein SCO1/2